MWYVQARVPPLIMASKDNSLKIVELLSMYGANINGHDKVRDFNANKRYRNYFSHLADL